MRYWVMFTEVTIVTSNVKWCIAIIVLTWWITVCLTDEVLGNVEVTIATSNVKWCMTNIISSHWVTVLFIDEVPYHLQVILDGSIAVVECVCRHPYSWSHTCTIVIRSMMISIQPWAAARWSRETSSVPHTWSIVCYPDVSWLSYLWAVAQHLVCSLVWMPSHTHSSIVPVTLLTPICAAS